MGTSSGIVAIRVSGTTAEKLAILATVCDYEIPCDSNEYSIHNHNAYIEDVEINCGLRFFDNDETAVEAAELTEDQRIDFIEKLNVDLYIEAAGPYAASENPYEYIENLKSIGLFERMAQAAPTASFTATLQIDDYIDDSSKKCQELRGDFSNGQLQLRYRNWKDVFEEDEELFWGEEDEDEDDMLTEHMDSENDYSEDKFWDASHTEWDSCEYYDPVTKTYYKKP